jgi:hypothetical protein
VIGSPLLAAWIAHLAFWGLLVYGWIHQELDLKRIALLVGFWLTAGAVLSFIPLAPARGMFSSVVAVLDIALVFMIFKGDVRLT